MMTFSQFKKLVLDKLDEYDKDTNELEDRTRPTQMDEQSWWIDFLEHAEVKGFDL